MDFVKDLEELYDKTNKHFKDKTRKDCLWGEVHQQPQLVSESVQDSVQIPKDSLQKTHPVQVWSGSQGNDREAELDSEQIELLKDAPSDERDSVNHQALSPWPEEPVHPQLQHTILPEVPPTQIAWKLALGTTQQPLIASNSVVSHRVPVLTSRLWSSLQR